jgi:hypothetical protein
MQRTGTIWRLLNRAQVTDDLLDLVFVELSVLQQFTRKLLKHVPVRVDDAMCLTYHFAHHRNAIGARLGDSIEHRQPLLAIVPAPDAVILIRTIPTCTPLRDFAAQSASRRKVGLHE